MPRAPQEGAPVDAGTPVDATLARTQPPAPSRAVAADAAAHSIVVITFHTHTDAIACQAACKAAGVEGRLVTIPRDLSAGCGYAWRCALDQRAESERVLADAGIEVEELHVIARR
ncbi:DUF3343 domain-containing protein [Berryella wangjianweii]|uniref:DUF3343 domain-containing protein n=1 Tax=Berryella wangjianweii TaxID=2734634 RepID=A0A6M8J2Q8_9ACTN|nr:DUF3343 domain-containing protein [Berryella wangjianweii]QKF07887.1 DUF3343 domain-containing protein [Berryella wangjianweii]